MTPYYEHGGTTIYHGDCREILPLVKADVLVTDPPYGVGMASFIDDFPATVQGIINCPATLGAVFMTPRRIVELATSIQPAWKFERLLWMHKTADIAAPWRGWCMNSEAILIVSRATATWPAPASYRSDVYQVGPWERAGHPNGKPLTVVHDLVSRLCGRDFIVIDPFAGSGTTLVAAKQLGRKAIGIEIEERYCEIAAKRLSQEVLPFGGANAG